MRVSRVPEHPPFDLLDSSSGQSRLWCVGELHHVESPDGDASLDSDKGPDSGASAAPGEPDGDCMGGNRRLGAIGQTCQGDAAMARPLPFGYDSPAMLSRAQEANFYGSR